MRAEDREYIRVARAAASNQAACWLVELFLSLARDIAAGRRPAPQWLESDDEAVPGEEE